MESNSSVRERIIDTATRLFYEQGFQATGINQIIAEANIAKSSLYQHFRSKDDLLIAYLSLSEKKWLEGLHEFAAGQNDPVSQVLNLFDYRTSLAKKRGLKGCAFTRLAYELPNIDGPAADLIKHYKRAIRNYIQAAVSKTDKFKSATAEEEMTDSIYFLFEGCGIEASIFNSDKPIERAKTLVNKLLK